MTTHRRRSVAAWLFAALGCGVLASSCIIPPEEFRGPCKADVDCADDGNPCTREVCNPQDGFCDKKPQDLPVGDVRCDDENPCTAEACSEGKCIHTAQELPFGDKGCDDGNDCTDDVCQSGACAHTAASVPPSDGNDCTTDSCENGTATHKPVADNTPCGKGGNLVCTNGECNCQTADECGTSTDCQKFACTNNVCSSTSLEQGTFIDNKDPGDCLKRVCDGMNNVVTVPDTTDPPPEVAGDCNKKACDANGNPTNIVDDTDKPMDDGNVCTTEACNNGVASNHTPVLDGSACGNPETCGVQAGGNYQTTPADACVGGVCTSSAAISCGLFKCNGTKCKTACAADADCIAGTFCDMATAVCKPTGDLGISCQNNGQCSSGFCTDGVCCNAQCNGLCERCTNMGSIGLCLPVTSGIDPDNECTGTDVCDGAGNCTKILGSACTMDNECVSGVCEDSVCCDQTCTGACKRCDLPGNNGFCSPVEANMTAVGCTGNQVCDGGGNCKTATGKACAQGSDCISNNCEDSVCCMTACAGSCARCDITGAVGTCTNVMTGVQVSGCNGSSACNGIGACKKINGQTCNNGSDCASSFCVNEPGVGKICCDTQCTDQCKSCAGTKTVGMVNGVCDNIKDKTDPDAECSGAGCNNGNGSGCCVISGGVASCMP